MRLFLALEVPPEVRTLIGEAVKEQRRLLPAARWVRQEALHLTLVFLGETPEADVPALEAAAVSVFTSRRPWELVVRGAGSFPPQRPGRVLWLGIEEGESGRLEELEMALSEALVTAIAFEPEGRPFHPHLTLARCPKPWPKAQVKRFREAFDRPWGLPFEVQEGQLLESRLEPSGARYRTVASFPLQGVA